MHLFFNDPRDGYVTRHRRVLRPSLAALVVGGVGVAALGVIIGSANYDGGSGVVPRADGGGFATPVATRGAEASGPLGMSTVPAAPQPILDLATEPSPAVPAPAAAQQQAQGAKKAVVRVERTTSKPKPPAAVNPAPVVVTQEPEPVVEEPPAVEEPVEEPAAEEPVEQPADEHQGRHRRHQWDNGDSHRWRPFWEPR